MGDGDEAGQRIGLAEMIAQLRSELTTAMQAGEGQVLRFKPESVELELQVTVTRGGSGEAGIKFWVVDAKAGGKLEKATVQTVKLKLLPVPSGGRSDVLISSPATEDVR